MITLIILALLVEVPLFGYTVWDINRSTQRSRAALRLAAALEQHDQYTKEEALELHQQRWDGD